MPIFLPKQQRPSLASDAARSNAPSPVSEPALAPVLLLQRTIGNRSVQRLLQRTCSCGAPAPGGGKCAACEEKSEKDEGGAALQREAASSDVPDVPPSVHEVLQSPGQPLDRETRDFMEPRFGEDFTGVRVHTDSKAGQSAREVSARAYTVGQHIVLGEGQSARASGSGSRLLAHELAHTVQQRQVSSPAGDLRVDPPDSPFEHDADQAADAVTAGAAPAEGVKASSGGASVSRDEVETWAQVHQRVLQGMIKIVGDNTITDENKRLGKLEEAEEEPRKVPLRTLFDSVPAGQARQLYNRLEPGAPTDDFAAYLKLHFNNNRGDALGILRKKFVDLPAPAPAPAPNPGTAIPGTPPAAEKKEEVKGEEIGKATAKGACSLPGGIDFSGVMPDDADGLKMNLDYWSLEYLVIRGSDEKRFQSTKSATGWAQAKAFLEANPDWRGKQTIIDVHILVGSHGATAAIKDVWSAKSANQYALDCFVSATLTQLYGIYLSYPVDSRDVAFDRDHNAFQINLRGKEGELPDSTISGLLENKTLDAPLALSKKAEIKSTLKPGDQVPVTNPYFDVTSPWFTENTIFVGEDEFWGHPLGRVTIEKYAEEIASKIPLEKQRQLIPDATDADRPARMKAYVLEHSYIKSYARPPQPHGGGAVASAAGAGIGAMTDIPELTEKDFARAIPARTRKRLMLGQFETGEDVAALRRFVGLTQAQFAQAMSISVHTLRNWEQGRRHPEGPAIALLRIAARHPRIIRENLESAVSIATA